MKQIGRELNVDPHSAAAALDAALEDVAHATAVLLPQATWPKEENRDDEPERPISPREK